MELAAESLEDTKLTAPFEGLINSIEVESFESVQPGTRLLTLYQEGALQAEVLIGFVCSGNYFRRAVRHCIRSRPSRIFSFKVPSQKLRKERLPSPLSQLSSPLMNRGRFLRSGVPVEVVIQVPFNSEKTVSLPLSALITHLDAELKPVQTLPNARGGQVFVFSSDTNILTVRDVTIVGMNEVEMQILDGLKEGERVRYSRSSISPTRSSRCRMAA